MVKYIGLILAALLLFSAAPTQQAQTVSGGGHRKVFSGGGGACSITGTFKDCFAYTENPISNSGKWTANSGCGASFNAVQAAGAGAFTSSGFGCAVLTGAGLTSATPSSRLQIGPSGSVGVTGPCIWADTAGNGYCWLLGDNLYKITAGSGSPIGAGDCPPVSGLSGTHFFQISVNGSHGITCTDLTGGTSGTTVTDSTFTTNKGGFLVQSGNTILQFGWN